ncbi:major capsid protein VP1 [Gokushovirinae Bog8989_22]|uniref:major capsid protein VP1 n=1 Tax=Gokushovirinae Bog8989_22 TaxID=1655650 RepID=UPI00063D534F|nr:major capsid protein VP1 [Gokushovirinae Bog8989_22]AKI26888.1 major capsid protein VP1 [Gokushovirinae Bog8989_22]
MSSASLISQHSFAIAPHPKLPRAIFNRTFTHKTTCNAGMLIPFLIDEIYPGDTFKLRSTFLARMSTPIYPVMDNLFIDTQFFFIPNRLLWTHWEQFMGYQENPGDSIDYTLPTITSPTGGYLEQTIYDYLGLPTKIAGVTHQALPLRAYNKVYNDWYRDQNLQDSVVLPNGDGPDAPTDYVLLPRGKRHDYFTSALPTPQKGAAVQLPLGTTAPILSNNTQVNFSDEAMTSPDHGLYGQEGTNLLVLGGSAFGATEPLIFGNNTGLYADLSSATSATINDLRLSIATQQYLERDMRSGTRYTEVLLGHWGIAAQDARLQRSEYLGGGSTQINFHPVAQTAPSDASGSGEESSPQGTLSAFATAVGYDHGFTKSFPEHGFILGLMSIRADYTYQQGAERFWFRKARFDLYTPEFANLGEQAVLNQEIYAQGTSADQEPFGYQEAWAELRYKPSRISGYFRSNATGTLDAWHLSQEFTSPPTLSPAFIIENPPMARVEAVSDVCDFIVDSNNKFHCIRQIGMYSVPGLYRL